MDNPLQAALDELNKNIFFREFSFSKNDFSPTPGATKEFADHVIWIDDLLIVYQAKGRDPSAAGSAEKERRWFQNKVLKKATSQVKDTLQYLRDYPEIHIQNQRGHVFNVNGAADRPIIKLITYLPGDSLPADCLAQKYKTSKSAGFIHILPWHDYLGICRTLVTPRELVEYFEFREALILRWHSERELPSEPALLGQFLFSNELLPPDEQYMDHLARFKNNLSDFDISYLLASIGDHLEQAPDSEHALDYYKILIEFAKLNRNYLKEVKKRIVASLEEVEKNRFAFPYRMIVPGTECGFLFIPYESDLIQQRIIGLRNLTLAAKYDQRLPKQIGVSFAKDGHYILNDWCYIEGSWEQDDTLEKKLEESYPFRKLKSEYRNIYEFEEE